MTLVGSRRPPRPSRTGRGSGATPSTRTTGVPMRVTLSSPTAAGSCTIPVTDTRSPTFAGTGRPVATNRPSAVASSPSGSNDCMWNPVLVTAVTTPLVSTSRPASGERCAAPWIPAIVTASFAANANSRLGSPGVLRASPRSGVPLMPGSPSPSKSLRSQPLGRARDGVNRDAPPGVNPRANSSPSTGCA